MRLRRAVLAMMLSLGACDSGSTPTPAPAPTPAPTNAAPTFTSATTVSVVENTAIATTIYQAAATDPNGDALTFSIAGGEDAARFGLTTGGALTFTAKPDFELPADANRDNVYLVQLRVSDGSLTATLNLQVAVTNSKEGIAVRRLATGFNDPVFVSGVPRKNAIYVVERAGKIYQFDYLTGDRTLVHTATNISTAGNGGVLAFVHVSPRFTTAFQSPIYLASASNGNLEVRELYPASNPYRVLLTIPHPANGQYHSTLAYPDGYPLYVLTDDGGVPANAQDPFSMLGKVLRIDDCGFVYPYCPPGDGATRNPYVVAMGLHAPGLSWDAGPANLYVTDAGPTSQEINMMTWVSKPSVIPNFGWPYFSGTANGTGTPPAGFVHSAPVLEYGPPLGSEIFPSVLSRLNEAPGLQGKILFGDRSSGSMWSIPAASLSPGTLAPTSSFEQRNADFAPDVGTIDHPVGIFQDSSGYLFLVDSDGEIYIIDGVR